MARPDDRPLGLAGRIAVVALAAAAPIIGLSSGYGVLAAAPYAAVGAFLSIRRPGNSIGWLLIGLAWAFALSFAGVPATEADLVAGTVSAPTMAIAVIGAWASALLVLLYFAMTIVFPSGRLPTGRWGRLARIALAADILLAVLSGFGPTISVNIDTSAASVAIPNPLAVLPDSAFSSAIPSGSTVMLLLALTGVVSMVVRLRRAHGVERAQLQWVVLSLAAILAGIIIGSVGDTVFDNGLNGLVWIPAEIAFVLPPIAIGIAILRYRLYEMDRIISRTIGYITVSAILAGVFVGVILVAQAILAPLTSTNTLAVAASTLVVFALFRPLQRRIQQRVDRRFNRARYDADQTLAAFVGGLRDEVDLGQLGSEIIAAVERTVQPASASLWIRR